MTQEQLDILSDIDFECAKLEDILHGEEGEIITHIRILIMKLLQDNNIELSRQERWWIFKLTHNRNGWTIPWDRMVYPSHKFFDKYTKVYETDIDIYIPKTTKECNQDQLSMLKNLYESNTRI